MVHEKHNGTVIPKVTPNSLYDCPYQTTIPHVKGTSSVRLIKLVFKKLSSFVERCTKELDFRKREVVVLKTQIC